MRVKTALYLLVSLTVVAIAIGQPTPVAAPLPASAPGYAKHKNKFYVYNGHEGQLFALDLSKNWTSESPTWTQLRSGPWVPSGGIAVSPDGETLLLVPGHRFAIASNIWSVSKAYFRKEMSLRFTIPVTLGTYGTAIIAGGNIDETLDAPYEIYNFDFDTGETPLLPVSKFLPAREMGRFFYGAVWSEYLKRAVYFGARWDQNYGLITTYEPESGTWEAIPTFGYNKDIARHCMASTDDGKKVLMSGNSEFFILDLETKVWTELAGGSPPRSDHACTVAGDYFLVWGGSAGVVSFNNSFAVDYGKPSTPVLIYKISANAWVQEYNASALYRNPDFVSPFEPTTSLPPGSTTSPPPGPGTSPQSPPSSTDSPVNIVAIAGGAAGAVIVVALTIFFIWRHKRNGTKQSREQHPSPETDHHNFKPDEAGDYTKREISHMPQTSHRTAAWHSPRSDRDRRGHEHDRPFNHNDGNMRDTKNGIPPSRSAPHYPLWGAGVTNDYTLGGLQDTNSTYNTPADPRTTSRSDSHFTPHRPQSPPIPAHRRISPRYPTPPHYPMQPSGKPRSRLPYDPQSFKDREMTHDRSRSPENQWIEERPGRQWHA